MRILVWILVFAANAVYATPPTQFASEVLGQDIQLSIRLPDSYNHSDDSQYPVLLVMDGGSHLAHLEGNILFMSQFAMIPEFIVVGVPSVDRIRYFTPTEAKGFEGRSGQAGKYLSMLSDELLPFLHSHYRASDYTALFGHSLSGLFVSQVALNHNGEFNAYLAVSPSLWWDDQWLVKHSKLALKKPLTGYWYLSMATEGGEMQTAFDAQIQVLSRHAPKSLRWQQEQFSNETHDSVPLQSSINALRDLFSDYNAVPEIDVMPLAEIKRFYQNAKDQFNNHVFSLNEQQYIVYGAKAIYEGHPQWGQEILAEGVARYPRSDNLWDTLAFAYERLGEKDKAKAAVSKALALAQHNNSRWLTTITKNHQRISAL
ncbi:alpha/beta hydrolase [Pseudoalteromonas sp. CNC9-20]|uniref:alpha/beta hydrolase-fold protein n=1 Tax=Pseudoalteromonas sp. CNC9-20 TaxID=2917750 RepID=UPI001EF63181|nr:alpha/beta hydrolase-fold protein [Pseudoalteromonas sp. CNC9-20]MCG7570307.1 alpha/beta hydrolase [Pseudoalteromonas sp. CNC9-20]